jgi:hypothetical protein
VKGFTFKWDRKLLVEMTKQGFRSCKTQWRQNIDANAAQANAVNQQKNRMRDRRLTVIIHLSNGCFFIDWIG